MVCYADPVVVNHVELNWASGCDLWCAMLRQWLWIMVNNDEPVVVYHGALCWANGCDSCCVILNQGLWNIVCYAVPVVVRHVALFWLSGCESYCAKLRPMGVNHGVLCCASGREPWWVILGQRLSIMVSDTEPVVVNHVVMLSHW